MKKILQSVAEKNHIVQHSRDEVCFKKPRVVWTDKLHQQFLDAFNTLGHDNATPKKILEKMNEPGLTDKNVNSHLQKYRVHLRRLGVIPQGKRYMNRSSSSTGQDQNVVPLPAQSLTQFQAAGLVQPSLTEPRMSVSPLMDQRSIFNFENPTITFGDGDTQPLDNYGSILPRNSFSTVLPTLYQEEVNNILDARGASLAANNSRLLPATQHSLFDNFSSVLPRDSFPLPSSSENSFLQSPLYQEEVNNSTNARDGSSAAATAEFGNSGYHIFNDFPQHQEQNNISDWDHLWDMRTVFNFNQDAAAASASFSTAVEVTNVAGHGQNQEQPSWTPDHVNMVNMNVDSERVTQTVTCPSATTSSPEQHFLEDLMNTLLNQEKEDTPLGGDESNIDDFFIDDLLL